MKKMRGGGIKYTELIQGKSYIIEGKTLKYIGQDPVRDVDEGHHHSFKYVLLHFNDDVTGEKIDIDQNTLQNINAVEVNNSRNNKSCFEPIINSKGEFICPECKFELPPNKKYWRSISHYYECALKQLNPCPYDKTKVYSKE